MKKLLSALLVMLLLFIGVMPVLGQDNNHSCSHDAMTIASLHSCVEHGVAMGHIDSEIATSLLAKLDAAQSKLDRGQAAVAVNVLNAFIHEVEAQSGVHIDEYHASHLAGHVQNVIAAIS